MQNIESIGMDDKLKFMNKWPSLKQLRYLVALYELRHFGDAAKACFVSQSTLSSGIQNLEELLECQLIERDNRHLVFSPIGEEVVVRSRELLARSQDLVEIARSQGDDIMDEEIREECDEDL